MIRHTQTNLAPGNCWQFAVASLLSASDPAELPDQVLIEQAQRGAYHNALQCYLAVHHRKVLSYVHLVYELPPLDVLVPRSWHLMEGPTVRSPDNGGLEHVCIGYRGDLCHDPHPSRAGLTQVKRLGFLVPLPATAPAWRFHDWPTRCLCRACGGFEPKPEGPR